jgi:competence protein ComFC
MKYQGRRSVARYLALALPQVNFHENTIITFVPSDGTTRRKRGFDQAELIAKHYAKAQRAKCATLLARSSHERQVGKSRKSRIENVKGNFVSLKNATDKRVILIDDVVTTGATVRECAKVLKEAGAKGIEVLAVAKK